ncbi:MAG: hypothetical protein IPJ97_06070 [Proteobacteria bacterium]|nr:hypothetical protein [Pseudomonadota bacterium]
MAGVVAAPGGREAGPQRQRAREIDGPDRASCGHRQHHTGTARCGRRHRYRGTRPGAAEHQAPAQSRRAGLHRGHGPAGGEYARFIDSLRPRGATWSVAHANTHGSVANALMVDSGETRYALVQSDVAAAAVTGQAAFAPYGPLRHLRAVAALFPEPVHVVIRSDDTGSIHSVSELRGKRIAVGGRGSGTRETAMQVPMTVLPLDTEAMTRVSELVPGLVPLAIPDRTYGLQRGAVDTVAATALLVASDAVPDASVKQVLEFLFKGGFAADRGVSASRLSRERALAGVTIPLHDGAADYFAASSAPTVESPAAATQ